MVALFSSLLAFLASSTAKTLVDRVLFFLAIKALLIALFVILVPIVFNNFIGSLLEEALTYLNNVAVDGDWGGVVEFTGVFGWLLDCFQIPAAFSVFVSAVQLRLLLKMIPFSPVK